MPILTVSIDARGPLILVGIGVSGPRHRALASIKQPIPNAVVGPALVDTGASCTCVDCAVIRSLGLSPSGTVAVHTPSTGTTPHVCDQYDVSIALVMDKVQIHIPGMVIPVIETDLSGQGIQALLGRDILEQGILIYDGRRRSLTLAF